MPNPSRPCLSVTLGQCQRFSACLADGAVPPLRATVLNTVLDLNSIFPNPFAMGLEARGSREARIEVGV